MQAQAIETYYRGCHFRSRLEARWAVFFEQAGLPWRYEPEGYALCVDEQPSIAYLPDFYVPALGHWIEVKPEAPTGEQRKVVELFTDQVGPLLLVCGMPSKDGHGIYLPPLQLGNEGSIDQYWPKATFGVCRKCEIINSIADDNYGWSQIAPCKFPVSQHCQANERWPVLNEHLISAYAAARRARFEHAERL
jgi:hypothetical protein